MDDNERMLIETHERSKSNTRRLDSLENEIHEIKSNQTAIYEIASSVKVLVERVGYIEERVEETGRKVDAQTEEWRKTEVKLSERITETENEQDHRVAKNVNSIKMAIITAICTALATGCLAAMITFN